MTESKSNAETAKIAEGIDGESLNGISEQIIGAAIEVHRLLGPGLLESTYETCLAHEMSQRGLSVHRQVPIPVMYKDVVLDCGYRIDLLVEECVIVGIKAVENVLPVHKAQLLSHLRLSGGRLGLPVNFHVKTLKSGIHRIVNQFPEPPRSPRSLR